MQPSDQELVRACQRGDEAAWEQLVKRYKRLIYAIPRRAGLDEDTAADVFQRVFLKLLNSIDQIAQPERISAWLVTTARRETWLTGRRERAASAALRMNGDENEDRELVDSAPLPEEWLLRLEEQHTLRSAIDSLNERCRSLLMLLFYHPDSPRYTEIAAALGIKIGSIGQFRARCLHRLLGALEEMGWE